MRNTSHHQQWNCQQSFGFIHCTGKFSSPENFSVFAFRTPTSLPALEHFNWMYVIGWLCGWKVGRQPSPNPNHIFSTMMNHLTRLWLLCAQVAVLNIFVTDRQNWFFKLIIWRYNIIVRIKCFNEIVSTFISSNSRRLTFSLKKTTAHSPQWLNNYRKITPQIALLNTFYANICTFKSVYSINRAPLHFCPIEIDHYPLLHNYDI